MAAPLVVSAADWPSRHKLSVTDFERMVEVGIIAPTSRIEPIAEESRFASIDVPEAPFVVSPTALPTLRLSSGEIWPAHAGV